MTLNPPLVRLHFSFLKSGSPKKKLGKYWPRGSSQMYHGNLPRRLPDEVMWHRVAKSQMEEAVEYENRLFHCQSYL